MIPSDKRFSSTRSLQQAFWCRGAKVERIARFFVFLDICDPFYPGIFFQAEGVLPKQPPSEVGVQTCRRSQNYSVFFATCDLLHSVHFCGSQEKEAAAVPREAKLQKIANFMFLLLLAGLLSLPKEPFLAAAIDGASPFRKFVYVTFPLMAPISIGAIIIRLIEASKIMDTVFVLTSGGPGTATETSSFYIYIKGLREFQMGYAATLSFTYLVIMIISLTIIAKVLTKLMIKE